MPVATSPVADGRALLTIDRATASSRAGTPTAAATDAAAGFHPLLQIPAQFCGIFGRKINLIGHPIKPEFHRFVGRAGTVEIIDQGDGHFFCHWLTLAFRS